MSKCSTIFNHLVARIDETGKVSSLKSGSEEEVNNQSQNRVPYWMVFLFSFGLVSVIQVSFTSAATIRKNILCIHAVAMKLADIKKLKVPDLRSKLKELGLDSGGLKAELVVRLWSFHEARPDAEVGETAEINPQDGTLANKVEVEVEAEAVNLAAEFPPPPPPESCSVAGVTPRCDAVPTKELTDTATQTEMDSSPPTAQQNPEFISTSELVHQPQDGDAEMEQSGAAGGPDVEDRGRGRAFYEFKEEIRYKR